MGHRFEDIIFLVFVLLVSIGVLTAVGYGVYAVLRAIGVGRDAEAAYQAGYRQALSLLAATQPAERRQGPWRRMVALRVLVGYLDDPETSPPNAALRYQAWTVGVNKDVSVLDVMIGAQLLTQVACRQSSQGFERTLEQIQRMAANGHTNGMLPYPEEADS